MEQIEAYNKYSFFQNDLGKFFLDKYSKLLTWKSNESVLDIGMGDGKFTAKFLLPSLPDDLNILAGCEYVPWKVEYARRKYPDPKIHFFELDIQIRELPQDLYEKFDRVFSFFVFNWVRDLRLATENMYKMMKPGAEFLIAIGEKNLDAAFMKLSKNPKWAPYGHEKYISKLTHLDDWLPYWRSLLQDTGFSNLNCFREYTTYRQRSKEVMEEIYKAINPIANDIKKGDLDEYYKEYLGELYKTRQCHIEVCPETQKEVYTSNVVILIIYGKKPDVAKLSQ